MSDFRFDFGVSTDSIENDQSNDTKKEETISSSFKFNFQLCTAASDKTEPATYTPSDPDPKSADTPQLEVFQFGRDSFSTPPSSAVTSYRCPDSGTLIDYYNEKKLEDWIQAQRDGSHVSEEVRSALHSRLDVIPGRLEGGFTLWQGSLDLVNWIERNQLGDQLAGSRVLEAGCGAALPALYALRRGAREVHTQDYNRDVLLAWTMPNFQLNLHSNPNCTLEFLSGDWLAIAEHCQATHCLYDIILTAETIYRVGNYLKLHRLFEVCLAPHGRVYLACKSKYYGPGGDMHDFLSLVNRLGQFKSIQSAVPVIDGVAKYIVTLTRR